MELLYSNDHITVDYSHADNEYRVSLFDNYGHYLEEMRFTKSQLCEMFDFLKSEDLECNEDIN